MLADPTIRVTDLAVALRTNRGYASQVLAGKRALSIKAACKAFRLLGARLPPIAGATDVEIAVLEKYCCQPARRRR